MAIPTIHNVIVWGSSLVGVYFGLWHQCFRPLFAGKQRERFGSKFMYACITDHLKYWKHIISRCVVHQSRRVIETKCSLQQKASIIECLVEQTASAAENNSSALNENSSVHWRQRPTIIHPPALKHTHTHTHTHTRNHLVPPTLEKHMHAGATIVWGNEARCFT